MNFFIHQLRELGASEEYILNTLLNLFVIIGLMEEELE